jgi:AraC-like DNA-binding protein
MLSQDPRSSSHNKRNPFHSQLLPGLSELNKAHLCHYRPPIPFQSPNNRTPSDLHAAFELCLPDLDLIALEGPRCREQLQSNPSPSILFIAQGEVCLEQQNASWCGSAGDCLIVQGEDLQWSSTHFSVVCLMFPEHQHALRIEQLHSQIEDAASLPLMASQPISRQHKEGKDVASLIRALHLLLCIISDLQTSCPLLLPHLKMGDQLGILSAMLAIPELRQASIELVTEHAPIKHHSILDSLIDYIDSHLSGNLSLDVLEDHSHYSRRSLQYAFRAEYGCTVTQWIRARRLDLAHRRLSLGAASDSVGEIARACGYRSMSLFSIEFQQRFHIKPSALLREARVYEATGLARLESTDQATQQPTDQTAYQPEENPPSAS